MFEGVRGIGDWLGSYPAVPVPISAVTQACREAQEPIIDMRSLLGRPSARSVEQRPRRTAVSACTARAWCRRRPCDYSRIIARPAAWQIPDARNTITSTGYSWRSRPALRSGPDLFFLLTLFFLRLRAPLPLGSRRITMLVVTIFRAKPFALITHRSRLNGADSEFNEERCGSYTAPLRRDWTRGFTRVRRGLF